jgi:hypothetical protein
LVKTMKVIGGSSGDLVYILQIMYIVSLNHVHVRIRFSFSFLFYFITHEILIYFIISTRTAYNCAFGRFDQHGGHKRPRLSGQSA